MSIPNPIESASKLIENVGDAVDKNFESEAERQEQLTKRLAIDMASDSWLAKSIRPMVTLGCFLMQVAILVALFLKIEVPTDIQLTVGGLLATCIGFYFNSRKSDKINIRKVNAAIKIEEIRAKASVQEARREDRAERKAAKRARKQQQ
jgi:hypothetical protein